MIRVQMYSEATGRPRVHPYMRQQGGTGSSTLLDVRGFQDIVESEFPPEWREPADIAQLVEQWFCKPQVGGSNPSVG